MLLLTPLGGVGEETRRYKGYGYATVIEILSASVAAGLFHEKCLSVSRMERKFHILWALSSLS